MRGDFIKFINRSSDEFEIESALGSVFDSTDNSAAAIIDGLKYKNESGKSVSDVLIFHGAFDAKDFFSYMREVTQMFD